MTNKTTDHQIKDVLVSSWSAEVGTLTDGRKARIGASCLIQPIAGDRVLVTQMQADVCWVLAILKRAHSDQPVRIKLRSSSSLLFQAPEINIRATQMHTYSEEFLSNTSKRHIVEDSRTLTTKLRVVKVESDNRTATTVEDVVRGALFQRFSLWLSNTTREARLKAQAFIYDKYSK